MIESVFIANRGEIAARVARTCHRLGIAATTSSGDYLDVEAQIAQALAAGADAVHPGYGFLSENPAFARAVTAAGLTWIGPPPEAMEAMARKDHAREIAVAAGVPVVPSYELGGFETGAERPPQPPISFPVLVKAAAGGGGKGMRIVREQAELAEATAAAAREARSAFGDDTLLIEKYVERGRHIEVQVMADAHGGVVHLFERDCSTQRRHQKVLEEAPAPTITPEIRELVTSSAVALAKQVGYRNAGTVEFLLDPEANGGAGEAYFLEMNTRLQVEHPVTELITGLDLVELQLRVAAGEPLPITQDDVTVSGHAIEARVYAEDSFGGFLPQAGRATYVRWPDGGVETGASAPSSTTVRVDQALESGQVVSTAYDPMLGKVIAHGATREEARSALVDALDATAILGLTTNTGFLRVLVASDEFRDATIDTTWLDRHDVPAPDPAEARRLAAWAVFRARPEDDGPFRSDGFRLGAAPAPVVIDLDERVRLTGPEPHDLPVADVRSDRVEVVHQGQRFVFERPDVFGDHAADPGDGVIIAPMPGTVLDVRVAEGDRVEAGQVLLVLEAMKMELSLKAPFDGTVDGLAASTGSQVALGATLMEVQPHA
ncbi:acetyl/propionyl/methylcrotonyl-CoA carboxylase subunit alpha [Nocardioides soli]|uniref:3-methylcrotonyl-CoA carboxylase alpha subunit/acetyl-CoA/propionyl-CoA carboxylase biotin carboxyl carrier protein n=1 Tax=Nocardioides soli TaxID=1036020 RepID=A0A7W4Z595_9ACTN|nr:biotin carboxylase N-terminal domain-containing protein [Nocardioides soli]MBB3045560.1 3-methylcrotonyl-CoA carboxylase alpha subunit/acetyl-CoA/propionyl-CoA carboxylase biotin carboxyl carrier protein [Nocardioides soli]